MNKILPGTEEREEDLFTNISQIIFFIMTNISSLSRVVYKSNFILNCPQFREKRKSIQCAHHKRRQILFGPQKEMLWGFALIKWSAFLLWLSAEDQLRVNKYFQKPRVSVMMREIRLLCSPHPDIPSKYADYSYLPSSLEISSYLEARVLLYFKYSLWVVLMSVSYAGLMLGIWILITSLVFTS